MLLTILIVMFIGAYDFMLHSSCMLLLPSMPGVEVNSLSISRKDKIIDQVSTEERKSLSLSKN